MQNKKIIQILKGAIVWLVLFLAVGGLGSWILFWKAEQEEKKLSLAKEDYRLTLAKIQSYDKIKANFESSKAIRGEMEKTVLNSDNTLELIEELEKAAAQTGVSLRTSIGEKPGSRGIISKASQGNIGGNSSQKGGKNQPEVWLQLDVGGRYRNILQFIIYLENTQKLVSIGSIDIIQAQSLSVEEILQNTEGTTGDLTAEILITGNL